MGLPIGKGEAGAGRCIWDEDEEACKEGEREDESSNGRRDLGDHGWAFGLG